jgi:hypothetical protein
MKYKIQTLKLGGILDQAVAINRDNFGLLFTILLYGWIPIGLVSGFLQLASAPNLSPDATPQEVFQALSERGSSGTTILVGILGLISALFVVPLTNAAVIYAIAERYLGRSITAYEAIRRALGKVAPLIGTWIVMALAIMGGFILFIIPGILFALWFGLSQHVVVLEDLSGTKALSRSKQLTRTSLGTFIALSFIIGLISFLFTLGTQFVPQKHLALILAIVVQAGLTMFSTAALVVYYFSCRCTVDNFDLELLAESIHGDEQSGDSELATGLDL